MNINKIGLAVIASVLTVVAHGQGFAYGIDSGNGLYKVDLSTASSTFIGTVNGNGAVYESLGLDSAGVLYGATVAGDLFSINTTSGVGTYIGTTGLGDIEGMDWDAASGRMLVSDFSGTPSVYSVNLSNATVQLLQTATSSGSVIRSLATRSSGSLLDVRLDTGNQGDIHGSYDLASGAFGTVGTVTTSILAMDYGTNGGLYGLTSTGDLVSINPGNGAVQTIGTANAGSFFLGMATVPEPASLWILGGGVAALVRRKKRLS